MQIVIAAIVVVLLGAGAVVLTRDSQKDVSIDEPAKVESRAEDVSNNTVTESDDDVPEDIPLKDTSPSAIVSDEPETTEPEPVTPEPVVTAPAPEPEPVVTTSAYADGTYSASANYRSPGGTHSADVTITIENDVVKSTSFSSDAKNSTSKKYVNRFANAYMAEVIGKDLGNISLSRVGGASLTTDGFNDALDDLRVNALN